MVKKIDLTGKTFGTIRVIEQTPSHSGKTYWNCECIICKKMKIIQGSHLKNGSIKSCGCGHILNENQQENITTKKCIICGNIF